MDRTVNKNDEDLEKRAGEADETGASSFEYGDSLYPYAKVQRLGGKLNVEQRGIERVPKDERTDNSYWNIGSMVYLVSRRQLRICARLPLSLLILPDCCSGWLPIWLSHSSRLEPWASRCSGWPL